jgi:hypothetical protein
MTQLHLPQIPKDKIKMTIDPEVLQAKHLEKNAISKEFLQHFHC